MKLNTLLTRTLLALVVWTASPLLTMAQGFTPIDVGGSSAGEPRWFTEANGTAYFSARTPDSDIELHAYDMASGNVTLIDLTPGVDQWGFGINSNVKEIVEVGGNIYFQATVDFDTELYQYNTTTGVFTKIDLNPSGSSMPTDIFVASNNMLYFKGREATAQGTNQELFEYNTSTGQYQMYEMYPGISQYGTPNSSYPMVQCEYQGKLYMNAEGPVGKELYAFDINTKQHTLIWDIAPGLTSVGNQYSSSPKEMTVFNGKIYGNAFREDEWNELIIYDPATGSTEFRVIDPGLTIVGGQWTPNGATPSYFTELNGDLYFMASVTTVGYELYKLDGQTDQITLEHDTWSGTYEFCQLGNCMTQGNLGDPKHFVVRDGLLYYTAASATRNYELWAHDPATGNSTIVYEYWTGISPLGDDNAGDLQWTTLLSNGKLIACGSTCGYEDELVVVDFSQTPQPQTINFPTITTKTYGDAPFTLNATATSGLSVCYTVQDGNAFINGNMLTITGAGDVSIAAQQSGNGSWIGSPQVINTFTVNKADLTVTADDKSKAQGTANPALTISYSGFVNGDDVLDLDTLPTASTTAQTSSPIGAYPITVSGGGDNNYAYNYMSGTMTVTSCNPGSIPATPSLIPFGLHLAQLLMWAPVDHPDLIGYNVYFDANDGSPVTMEFVAAGVDQWYHFGSTAPATYSYEVKAVIDVPGCGQVESTNAATADISYEVIMPQCNIGGMYILEYEFIGGIWMLNVYKNGTLFANLPLSIDNLFWCSQYGGVPIEAEAPKAKTFGVELSDLSFDELLETIESSVVATVEVYPNPSIDNTSITYSISKDSDVQIELVDISGRVVAHLVNGNQNAGDYRFDLNLANDNIGTGIYFLQARFDGNLQVKKLIVE